MYDISIGIVYRILMTNDWRGIMENLKCQYLHSWLLPIHLMFGSRVGFLVSEDQTALLLVQLFCFAF